MKNNSGTFYKSIYFFYAIRDAHKSKKIKLIYSDMKQVLGHNIL